MIYTSDIRKMFSFDAIFLLQKNIMNIIRIIMHNMRE